jgi:regulator of nonsense transcripts 2
VKQLASLPRSTEMKLLLSETYITICNDLVEAHKQYRHKEAKAEKDRLIHGSLTDQKQSEYDYSKKLFEKLLSVATSLSECMNEDLPELKIEKEEEEKEGGITVWEGSGGGIDKEEYAASGLFGDPETRSFYEDLPDLLSLVPLSILGLTHEQATVLKDEWTAKEQLQKSQEEAETTADQVSKLEQEIASSQGMYDCCGEDFVT